MAPLALFAAGDKKIPVGLELYSVRAELAKDLTGTVTAVAKMGYQVVEFFAPYYQWTEDYAKQVRKLMDDLACMSCHRINGHGSDMAPDLSLEGSAVQRAWLDNFLKNPNTLRPSLTRRMPRFNLSDADRKVLTDYIMVVYQSPDIDPDKAPPAVNPPALVEQGRQLFYSRYACQSCHMANTNTDKGYIGPVLAQVGTRLTPAWIYAWLKNPQALRPGTMEPNQNIGDEDARAMTAFLMTLKSSGKQEGK